MTAADKAFQEAGRQLRSRAIVVGIEHGDYAAKIVIDDAIFVEELADDGTTELHLIGGHLYVRHDLLDNADADDHDRLVAYLEDHDSQQVGRALKDYRAGNR